MPGIPNRMLSFIRHPKDGGAQTGTQSGGPEPASQTQQQKQNHQRQQPVQLFQNQQLQEHFHQQLQQPQKPPQQQEQTPPRTQVHHQRQGSHQQLADAHKLPVPKFGLRQAASQPTASSLPRAPSSGLAQAQTSQHIRANSDGVRGPPPSGRPHHDTWEDSTIGSLLDSERQSERDQQRMVPYEPRVDPAPQPRAHAPRTQPPSFQHERNFLPVSTHSGEHGPFILNENGYIRSVDHSKGGSTALVHGSLQNGKRIEANTILDEPFADRSDAESTPRKQLKHSKIAIRDARDVAQSYQDAGRRRSYVEAPIFSRQEAFPSVSPEHHQNGRDKPTRAHADRRSRDMSHHHRSTQFFDLETAQQTPVPPEDQSDAASQEDEALAEQRTPRPSKSKASLGLGRDAIAGYPPPLTNNWPQTNGVTSVPPVSLTATRQHSFPPSAANGSRQTAGPRVNSNREQLTVTHQKKRRLSLDYDDQALSRMDYTELRNESFDHDPARSAIQRTNTPSSGDTLVQKLSHYQNQDENSQHHFFTRLSVSEWDECGDWFLGRFGELVGEIKAARREKREIVSHFEGQISAREQAVRNRTEKIEQALTSLKHEGEGMMKGKDINI
ncbi:uncharacterized protein PgNI_01719 [Pyricularia grisea]|uniref:Extracellular mutant protein 11 C-terminal domain-containing protein n=1 Tax=Pyricularia grisea TaxID=148305 RepID=A0A6P8BMA8_PYRGI|nr:uncharacterized protein PgNI_01719 [Pyricularia grisea]TLD17692.1 hypothetical protein PgNI_01719 [Pyricularia grisea]